MHANFHGATVLSDGAKADGHVGGPGVRARLVDMRIAALHTYPVKGCHRLHHGEVRVEPWGLTGDRRWIVIDPDGVGITQRIVAALSLLRVTPARGGIVLNAPGMSALGVAEPVDGPKEDIRVFRHKPPAPARLAEPAAPWLSAFLQRPARLAWQADPTGRPVRNNALPDDRVSFADGYPLLLANEASLEALNGWMDEPLPMTRHTSVPQPSAAPRKWPVSIGPPGTTSAGRSTDEAAISSAGMVLSQPPSSTTPSTGLARSVSSIAIAARLRHSIAVGRTWVSPIE